MRLSLRGVREAAAVVVSRFAVLIPLALLINRFLMRGLLGLPPAFEKALFTFFILPPPFIIPLFIGRERSDERAHANNVLSVYTAVSLAAFIIYFAMNPTL